MSFVMDRIQEHYQYATKNFDQDNVIGIFLTGSQNYGTDMPFSDVDTKLLITPTLEDIYHDKKGESSTIKMPDDSNEMISIKDIRTAIYEIKKQNINMLELLYTDYCILNPIYKKTWELLVSRRDEIVKYNPYLAAKATKGNALNGYDRMYKENGDLNQKQVANLVRYQYYLDKYLNGAPYENCLRPDDETVRLIKQIRMGEIGKSALVTVGDACAANIQQLADEYCETHENNSNILLDSFLDDIVKSFIDISLLKEYEKRGEI